MLIEFRVANFRSIDAEQSISLEAIHAGDDPRVRATPSGQTLHFNPETPEHRRLLLKPHFLKRKEYESEQEVRFVTTGPDLPKQQGIIIASLRSKDWIERVRLCPKSSPSDEKTLKNLVKKMLPDADCSKSSLLEEKTGPRVRDCPFRAELETSAETQWKRGTDSIPEVVKQERTHKLLKP